MDSMRIDKWLWAARFFKTRSLAQDEVGLGRVLVGGQRAKPSRDVRVGDRLEIHRGEETFTVYVEGLSNVRGPAAAAQQLYRETEESRVARETKKAAMKLAFEPSTTIRQGRPTKREGRELRRFKESF
ncbi:RNA-binding S4 domain-containing protein [Sutterella sp.]|uniref:RNA-binding S4 domain-containing protein n=1 Tax=Sutterella sp. TaxID=1981025 RepID=UPI0025CC57B0|nr:RNA-binding S4 domain-containing protein [uncultured Sutterella sp.]